jgi:hypothetical protein
MGYKMKGMSFGNSPMKQTKTSNVGGDAKTGHGGPKFPDVVYTADGTAKQTSQIDEELLDLKPSIGPKGKFVNYTDDITGEVTKYYYKKP